MLRAFKLSLHVQQQQNGSDCRVFAAAFATCLVYGIPPQAVQFEICKMREHTVSHPKEWSVANASYI